MSLKAVHICFIVLSIALAFGLGYWGIQNYTVSGDPAPLYLGLMSLAGGGGLIYYLFRFIQKMKKINPLPLLLAGILLDPPSASACLVCFGDPDSASSKAVTAAVLFLIGVVVFVLGWIGALIFLWSRKARKIRESAASP